VNCGCYAQMLDLSSAATELLLMCFACMCFSAFICCTASVHVSSNTGCWCLSVQFTERMLSAFYWRELFCNGHFLTAQQTIWSCRSSACQSDGIFICMLPRQPNLSTRSSLNSL